MVIIRITILRLPLNENKSLALWSLVFCYCWVKWWQLQIHPASIAAPAVIQKGPETATFCHYSILQTSHFRFLSCLVCDGRWCATFSDLADSRGSLMLRTPFMLCFLPFSCRWTSCSGNTQGPFLAFQYRPFEARAVNISPGRWVRLTPHRTCLFPELNHSLPRFCEHLLQSTWGDVWHDIPLQQRFVYSLIQDPSFDPTRVW